MTCCVYRQKRRLPCRSLTADAFPGRFLWNFWMMWTVDVVGLHVVLLMRCLFSAVQDRAVVLDLVLLVGASAEVVIRARLFLALFLLEIIGG